jgi:hypothetical protein
MSNNFVRKAAIGIPFDVDFMCKRSEKSAKSPQRLLGLSAAFGTSALQGPFAAQSAALFSNQIPKLAKSVLLFNVHFAVVTPPRLNS